MKRMLDLKAYHALSVCLFAFLLTLLLCACGQEVTPPAPTTTAPETEPLVFADNFDDMLSIEGRNTIAIDARYYMNIIEGDTRHASDHNPIFVDFTFVD